MLRTLGGFRQYYALVQLSHSFTELPFTLSCCILPASISGASDTAVSSAAMRAAIANAPTNTHWNLNPKLLGMYVPLGLDYLVVHVSEDGAWCLIGVPKRTNLWIMTRAKPAVGPGGHAPIAAALSAQGDAGAVAGDGDAAKAPQLSAGAEVAVLQAALAKAKEEGYDVSKVLRIQWTV